MAGRKKKKPEKSQVDNKRKSGYRVVDFTDKENNTANRFEKIILELAKGNPSVDPKSKKCPDT